MEKGDKGRGVQRGPRDVSFKLSHRLVMMPRMSCAVKKAACSGGGGAFARTRAQRGQSFNSRHRPPVQQPPPATPPGRNASDRGRSSPGSHTQEGELGAASGTRSPRSTARTVVKLA